MANIAPLPPNTPKEVRKHIAAVHVAGDLTTIERKVINVLLLNAYDDLTTKEQHCIPVQVLCSMIGWGDSNNTEHLKNSLRRIVTTSIEFDLLYNGEKEKKRKRWAASTPLAGVEIVDGIVTYEYSKILRTALANPEIYAIINIGVQREFSGSYALALYENCVRFKNVKSTGFISVEHWRSLLGVDRYDDKRNRIPTAYDEFKHFNNQIIKPSVKEVNAVSNIYVTPEYQREGRKVAAIRFDVQANPQGKLVSTGRTDDEIRESEAYKLLRETGVSDKAAVSWIADEPERALQTARITHDKMSRGQIKKSAAGYATTLFTNGLDLLPPIDGAISVAKAEPLEKVQARAEQDAAQARATRTDAAIAALTDDERAALVAEFIATHPAKTYDPVQRKFRDAGELLAYRTFTRQRAPGVIAARTV
jgi:plasmid replication initiation protein